MPDQYVPSYTDTDVEAASNIGRAIAANLDGLMATESKLFRDARRAAVEAASWARWHGRSEYEQMSAALHAANAVMTGSTAPEPRRVCSCWRLRPDGSHGKGCDLHAGSTAQDQLHRTT